MKAQLFPFVLGIILSSCATSYQAIKFDQPYSKVFENLPGTKDELFVKANEWMIKSFINAESVIEYSDKEAGALMGKYLMSGKTISNYYGSVDTRVFAKIDVRIKDGKAMITIEPLGQWMYDPSGLSIYNYSKEQALTDMDKLSNNLQTSLMTRAIDF